MIKLDASNKLGLLSLSRKALRIVEASNYDEDEVATISKILANEFDDEELIEIVHNLKMLSNAINSARSEAYDKIPF